MAPTKTLSLQNFFRYYEETNANHVAAISLLSQKIPNLLKPNSDWVVTFRGGRVTTEAVNLNNFFKFYSDKVANHVAAVDKLQRQLTADLLFDDAEWVKKYREKPPAPSEINLKVPYYNQVDNYRDAYRTCNSSSCAMCLEFLKPGTLRGAKGDDAYIQRVFAIGDTTDHSVQTKVLASYGVSSDFYYNLGFDDIDNSLENGKPVVIGILHRGSLYSPTGGHMIVVRGKTAKGDYYVNDPYGSLNDNYTGAVENGKNVVYTKDVLAHRWLDHGANKTGWGRIFLP
jgi:uncharacterized protein YvpB